ncbi:MAG: family 78 glycoside hydrolase catalytic domain [Nocardioidaceae bacterium]
MSESFLAAEYTSERLAPYGLTCELLDIPLGVDEPRPRLSWKLASDRRGDAQTAYRIRVAAHPDDVDEPGRVLWDTGRRTSGETLHVDYDGPPLQSSTRYHWRVSVWDADGHEAGSAHSWFETGVLHADEWVAAWIGHDPATDPLADPPRDTDRTERTRHLRPCPHLRRSFFLEEKPVRGRAYATARGVYELRLNGHRAGDAELAPGWTEYHHRVLYQTYDVTQELQSGDNVLGAVLADGWWSGFVGMDAGRPAQHYGNAPRFLVQLVLDFADGSRRVVASDGRWREATGAIRYADLLMGEYVDARRDLPGWDRPGYDDRDWTPVKVVGRDHDVLRTSPDHPVRATDELPARSVTPRPGGAFVVDLGQNMVGRVRLTVRDPERGQRIHLRHAEALDADGGLYVANLRTAEATDVYVAAGDRVEVFEPRFTFHGFRYIEVSGYPGPLRPADLTGRVLRSDTPWVGDFRCSDEGVMRLQSNIRWGQRGNFVSVPTDCPQRDERLGWLADAQVFLPTACRNADVSAFFARWMRDVLDAQDEDGAFPDVAPKVCMTREGAPAWGDGGVIIPWHLYKTYGDVRVLERSFEGMAAWVERVHRYNPGLLWRAHVGNHYGDWLQVDAETPRDVLATAYFARSTELVAAAAAVLGRQEEVKHYADLHVAIRDAFAAEFIDEDGTVRGGTQTAHLLALAFDLMPRHLVSAAVHHLAADIESRGDRLTTGFAGVALLCPVLAAHGRADLAYALVHQDSYPSWGYSIAHGATTVWERWDGWTETDGFQSPAMNSFNHYSLGSVGDWLYGWVAGIDQDAESVAYRRLSLRPTIGGRLTWAAADYESPRGRVSCGWRLTDDGLRVNVAVPPGVTAVLRLPTGDPSSVRESDAPLSQSAGVEAGHPSADLAEITLGSGRYSFSAARPRVHGRPTTSSYPAEDDRS